MTNAFEIEEIKNRITGEEVRKQIKNNFKMKHYGKF